ncbi:hypothetical protein EK904_002679 [Melospiza melodia maxima]|nr:hypothetical protein EK904_002679 [Melospiza melodia maxima]
MTEFDKKYNPTWHCIVGRNFGSYVTHETKHFIYFYLGQVAILLFNEFGEILPYLRGELSDALHKVLVRPPVTSNNLTQNRDNLETVEIIEPAQRDGSSATSQCRHSAAVGAAASSPLCSGSSVGSGREAEGDRKHWSHCCNI